MHCFMNLSQEATIDLLYMTNVANEDAISITIAFTSIVAVSYMSYIWLHMYVAIARIIHSCGSWYCCEYCMWKTVFRQISFYITYILCSLTGSYILVTRDHSPNKIAFGVHTDISFSWIYCFWLQQPIHKSCRDGDQVLEQLKNLNSVLPLSSRAFVSSNGKPCLR